MNIIVRTLQLGIIIVLMNNYYKERLIKQIVITIGREFNSDYS